MAGPVPDSIDWRAKGAVTPVKHQGQCGSCWAFSTTGVLEGAYFIKTGKLVSFSEQQLVDCATNAGYGCQGGWPYLALQYAGQYGVQTEADYPYAGVRYACRYNGARATKANGSYRVIQSRSTDALKAALAEGPVSVLVQATEPAFQFYKSGVLVNGCSAGVNHAVLAVGYKKVGSLDAFIIKNSWGTTWGEQGYMYLSSSQQINGGLGACGVLSQIVAAA